MQMQTRDKWESVTDVHVMYSRRDADADSR